MGEGARETGAQRHLQRRCRTKKVGGGRSLRDVEAFERLVGAFGGVQRSVLGQEIHRYV